MAGSLSSSETEAFINFYLSQEILWNTNHPHRHKKEHRTAALRMVATQMASQGREMTEDQVNAKIASLRTYYGRELKKVVQSEKSGAAQSDIYKSTWEYFNILNPFLRRHVQPRHSTSNYSSVCLPDNNTDRDEGTCSIPLTPSASTSSEKIIQPNDSSPKSQEQDENEDSHTLALSTPLPKKKLKISTTDKLNTMMMSTLQDISNRRKEKEKQDSDDLFGKQVALELKNIEDRRKKQILKMKINELIFQYQFET